MIQASNVLNQLLEPVGRSITPGLARELVDLRASPDVQARIDDLAEKCNEGTLSPEEQAEYERYVGGHPPDWHPPAEGPASPLLKRPER